MRHADGGLAGGLGHRLAQHLFGPGEIARQQFELGQAHRRAQVFRKLAQRALQIALRRFRLAQPHLGQRHGVQGLGIFSHRAQHPERALLGLLHDLARAVGGHEAGELQLGFFMFGVQFGGLAQRVNGGLRIIRGDEDQRQPVVRFGIGGRPLNGVLELQRGAGVILLIEKCFAGRQMPALVRLRRAAAAAQQQH